jgi:serine protease
MLVYAEPKFIPKVIYTPNDPDISLQYFLGKIQAYNAWNISKGDTNIVIGITDTGTDPSHVDLAGNIKHNYADPVNGIDDDGDTYTDNYSGWDLGENDNDPTVGLCGTCGHGSHVSGCAAAVTDNGIGVASPGFKSKFLPVKIANASGALTMAYEGIVYAADHGCQIINCSWGSLGGGQLGQDAVTYAAINKNALVVCGAGNTSFEEDFYPASYQYALSVAATDDQDSKPNFSTYGISIDVCAPGVNIYSTIWPGIYSPQSGTSMASPVTAGAAGIVKSFYPSYTGLQVGEQLRVTADNVDNAPGNAAYANKLGKGRINLYRALTESHPSVRMENMVMTDNNDDSFVINDTIDISGDFINFLAPTSNLVVTLSTLSTYVTILDSSTTAGVIPTLGTYNNSSDPFKVRINPTAPVNSSIKFRLNFSDGSYTDFQYFFISANVDYINVAINDIGTTVTSRGRIGYNGTSQSQGLGMTYKGSASLLYEAGLMIGNDTGAVSDMVRGNPAGTTDNDFQTAQPVHYVLPSVKSERDISGIFNDNLAPSGILHVLVRHNFYVWTTPGNMRYVIFEYIIKNNGSNALNTLYAGIYADLDIGNAATNMSNTDPVAKMGYSFNTATGGVYAGIKVLTPSPFIHFATDNDGTNGGMSNYDGFSSLEKYLALSTNHYTAGGTGTGNDVSNIVSTGPFSLNPGDSVTVAFALVAGDDLNDLINNSANAQDQYNDFVGINEPIIQNGLSFGPVYPDPAKESATISIYAWVPATANLTIMDVKGKVISTSRQSLVPGSNSITIDTRQFASGMYACQFTFDGKKYLRKFIVNR